MTVMLIKNVINADGRCCRTLVRERYSLALLVATGLDRTMIGSALDGCRVRIWSHMFAASDVVDVPHPTAAGIQIEVPITGLPWCGGGGGV